MVSANFALLVGCTSIFLVQLALLPATNWWLIYHFGFIPAVFFHSDVPVGAGAAGVARMERRLRSVIQVLLAGRNDDHGIHSTIYEYYPQNDKLRQEITSSPESVHDY